MSDPYIGEIRLFSYVSGFTVYGYLPCNGGTYSPQQYPALFAIIGNQFGGDGKTTFKVPNLPAHVVIGAGTAPGLTPRVLAQTVGAETVTLTEATMPNHNHTFQVAITSTVSARKGTPNNTTFLSNFLNGTANQRVWNNTTPNTPMAQDTIGATGATAAHTNIQPVLTACYYQIAYDGEFPLRSN